MYGRGMHVVCMWLCMYVLHVCGYTFERGIHVTRYVCFACVCIHIAEGVLVEAQS